MGHRDEAEITRRRHRFSGGVTLGLLRITN
jgi:hypothetical protein